MIVTILVVNEDFDQAVAELAAIIQAERAGKNVKSDKPGRLLKSLLD